MLQRIKTASPFHESVSARMWRVWCQSGVMWVNRSS